MVAVMDVQRMTVKAFDMSLLLEENIFEQGQPDDGEKQSIPIEESGIDFLNKSYVIGHVADKEADNYIGLILPINDPYKFRDFATSHAIKKPGEGASNVTYVMVGEGAILGWNTKTAIYLLNQNVTNERALTSELYRLFDLPEENQMFLRNKSFMKMQEEDADISMWFDLNKINKYRNPVGMLIPGQKASQGIYNAWIDFEKGSMNMRTRYYANADASTVKTEAALVLKENINKNMLAGVDERKIVGSFNLGVNIPIIRDQLRKDGMLDSSQTYLDMVNTNTGEILDMLTGDMTSCLLKNGKETDFYISLGIKNPETSSKIIQSLYDFNLIQKVNGYYSMFNQYLIIPQDYRLILTSDQEVAHATSLGETSLPNQEFVQALDNNPFVFYLDFDSLPPSSYERMKSYWKELPFNTDELEMVYFSQSSINQGVSEGRAYVNFKNKDKNSLTIIAKAIKKYSDQIES